MRHGTRGRFPDRAPEDRAQGHDRPFSDAAGCRWRYATLKVRGIAETGEQVDQFTVVRRAR